VDLYRLAQGFRQDTPQVRVRFGTVVSVEDDRTCTVTVGASPDPVPGVRYLRSASPLPGAPVVLVTDGTDLLVLDHMAAEKLTVAPRATRSTAQTIATATDTAVVFDGVNSDEWGAWAAGQPARLTAPLTGRYMAVATVTFAGNATGIRSALIEKTGTATVGRMQVAPAAGLPTWLSVTSPPFDMIAGTDYVRLVVRQASGGDLDLNSSTFSPTLSLVYLGP
jgi:hypothetical protein